MRQCRLERTFVGGCSAVALLLRWLDLSLASDAWNLLTAEVGRSVGQEVGRLGESEIDRRVQVGWYAKEEGALAFALCDKCEAQVCQPLSLSLSLEVRPH